MTTAIKKKARRDYGGLPGVTDVIGQHLGWKTNALIGWAYKLGKEGRSMRERDDAADAGSAAHAYAASLLGGEKFDELEWMGKGLELDKVRANGDRIASLIARTYGRVIAIEKAVIAESFGGTIDYVVQARDGRVIVLDVKTGKGIYDEVAVQLGAYAWLWRIDCARSYPPEIAAQGYATEGAILHAPYGGDAEIKEVHGGKMAAGEQIFRNLLEIHQLRAGCALHGEDGGGL